MGYDRVGKILKWTAFTLRNVLCNREEDIMTLWSKCKKNPYLVPKGSPFDSKEISVIEKLIQIAAFRTTMNVY